MMRKLDERGVAAFEMTLVFVPLFTLMFVIFDLGRYAITQQSLNALADAGARAVMINCYTNDAINNKLSSVGTDCVSPSNPLTTTAMQNAAPFLFFGGLTPTLSVTAGANALTVTASQPSFTMLMPIWGTALNGPSATTTIPF
jgi:Flp pilus assembly protein TadG